MKQLRNRPGTGRFRKTSRDSSSKSSCNSAHSIDAFKWEAEEKWATECLFFHVPFCAASVSSASSDSSAFLLLAESFVVALQWAIKMEEYPREWQPRKWHITFDLRLVAFVSLSPFFLHLSAGNLLTERFFFVVMCVCVCVWVCVSVCVFFRFSSSSVGSCRFRLASSEEEEEEEEEEE